MGFFSSFSKTTETGLFLNGIQWISEKFIADVTDTLTSVTDFVNIDLCSVSLKEKSFKWTCCKYIALPSIQLIQVIQREERRYRCDLWQLGGVWNQRTISVGIFQYIIFEIHNTSSSHFSYFFTKVFCCFFTERVADFLPSKLYLWRISLNGVVNVDEHQEEGHQHCHPEEARKDDIWKHHCTQSSWQWNI